MSGMALQIDVLYTRDCVDWEEYARLVDAALGELGVAAEFNYYLVQSDRQAVEIGFIGSPTIRVNGEDLFPVPRAASGMRLRAYFTPEGMVGCPTYDMIREALSRFV
jgi:hypothetical protein